MNIAELATNVARDIGAVRQRSCKRADGVEYHFEQSELEQFAKELIAEYEKAAGSEPVAFYDGRKFYVNEESASMCCADMGNLKALYARPDPRVAELEAELAQEESASRYISTKFEELEAQNAELLVAIEAKQKALKMVEWEEYNDPDWGMQVFCPDCLREKKHGHYECRLAEALALAPSTELLEARDRVRDAKLLRIIEQRIQPQDSYQDDYFKAKVHSYNIVNELIKQRESGEWQPLLDGD